MLTYHLLSLNCFLSEANLKPKAQKPNNQPFSPFPYLSRKIQHRGTLLTRVGAPRAQGEYVQYCVFFDFYSDSMRSDVWNGRFLVGEEEKEKKGRGAEEKGKGV